MCNANGSNGTRARFFHVRLPHEFQLSSKKLISRLRAGIRLRGIPRSGPNFDRPEDASVICNHGFGIRSVDRSSHWAGCFRSHRIKTALAAELVPLVSRNLGALTALFQHHSTSHIHTTCRSELQILSSSSLLLSSRPPGLTSWLVVDVTW